jgi:hypothetical protein
MVMASAWVMRVVPQGSGDGVTLTGCARPVPEVRPCISLAPRLRDTPQRAFPSDVYRSATVADLVLGRPAAPRQKKLTGLLNESLTLSYDAPRQDVVLTPNTTP